MIELFFKGGLFFMVPLLLASVTVIAIGIERFLAYRRATVHYETFRDAMRERIRAGGVAAALREAQSIPGPVSRVWCDGLTGSRLPFPLIRERMEAAALEETGRLERFLPYLAVIAQVAPLVGILGTVWGMIASFQVVEGGLEVGRGIQGEVLAGGIWQALVTTAAGLLVAIPALLIHHYLVTRVDEFMEALERSVADLIACLVPLRSRPADGSAESKSRGQSSTKRTVKT